MKRFFLAFLLLPVIANAQISNAVVKENAEGGIKWTTGLSWEQIKQKAKTENKYIFLDVYATWCGPCKDMDATVFTNDSVGEYFKKHFINIKVQLDRTAKDDEQVKSWYEDAATIAKQYHISSLPTFIFFNSQGNRTEQRTGYQKVYEFISLAQSAIEPGKRYSDFYVRYDSLIADYRKGIVHYDQLPDMIRAATRVDTASRQELMKLHKEYVITLPAKKRYTKQNIKFWSSLDLGFDSPLFKFFLVDASKINKVMGYDGYAALVVDKVIQSQIVTPFLTEQNTRKEIPMAGMYLDLTSAGLHSDSSEADWKKLYNIIKEQFNHKIAERNLLQAKIDWFMRHGNVPAYCTLFLTKLEKYPPELKNIGGAINNIAFDAFEHVIDTGVLNGYIKWMKAVIDCSSPIGCWLDTYANLLYKVGRKKEALEWEEKAVLSGTGNVGKYRETCEKMRKGEFIVK